MRIEFKYLKPLEAIIAENHRYLLTGSFEPCWAIIKEPDYSSLSLSSPPRLPWPSRQVCNGQTPALGTGEKGAGTLTVPTLCVTSSNALF